MQLFVEMYVTLGFLLTMLFFSLRTDVKIFLYQLCEIIGDLLNLIQIYGGYKWVLKTTTKISGVWFLQPKK